VNVSRGLLLHDRLLAGPEGPLLEQAAGDWVLRYNLRDHDVDNHVV